MELIVDNYSGRHSYLTDEERAELSVSGNLCLTAAEIRNFMEKRFGVEYTLSGVTNLLHELGLSFT
jgi:transposase